MGTSGVLLVVLTLTTASCLQARNYSDGTTTSSLMTSGNEHSNGDLCPPIPGHVTALKTGRKAWDKCIEYQELVYPCVTSSSLVDGDKRARANYCAHAALPLLSEEPIENEFTHMVMLGYGADAENLEWICAGTLISEHFVVTAAHCTNSREFGDVTHVHIAAYRRSQPLDSRRTYLVAQIIRHPHYNPPKRHNDIALLKTARPMVLDQHAVPACLDIGEPIGDRAVTTGWGNPFNTDPDALQKVQLHKFSTEECRVSYCARSRRDEFQESSQLCYGDRSQNTFNCQGDSGGPLQTYNKRVLCMYWLVGVTSVGKPCDGVTNSAGFYTRVSELTPWIESVVWP